MNTERCPTCHGHGTIPVRRDPDSGHWHDGDCPTCHGYGHVDPFDTRPTFAAVTAALAATSIIGVTVDNPYHVLAAGSWLLAVAIAAGVGAGLPSRRAS